MTQAQKLASNPEYSVWVNASAGTGKTKVLTDRVLRILLDGTPPGKILCITFTNAAAAEMANRIQQELSNWATMDDTVLTATITKLTDKTPSQNTLDNARRLFLEVLETPEGMKIQTIHAFCQGMMKRFPVEAGISPHFEIIEEQTAKELLQQAKSQLLSSLDEGNEILKSAFDKVIWHLHDISFNELFIDVINERDKIENVFSRYSLTEIKSKTYQQLNINENKNYNDILTHACSDNSIQRSKLLLACDILLKSNKTDQKKGNTIASWLSANQEERVNSYEEYKQCFFKKSGNNDKLSKLMSASLAKKYPDTEEVLLKEQQRLEDLNETLNTYHIAEGSINLCYIIKELLNNYQRVKERRGVMDYNDLIIKTNHLLNMQEIAPWVLYKLDGGVDHLLVDEAQDTSPQQWQVINAISEEFFVGHSSRSKNRTLFVVGDEKQSIYSFQGADPDIFIKMQALFSERIKAARKTFKKIELDRSFRSTPAILECVDSVFANSEYKNAITKTEKQNIQHQSHRINKPGKVEIWPLYETNEQQELQPWTVATTYQKESSTKKLCAENIAQTIKTWLKKQRVLPAKSRPVQPGDILILVRTRSDFVNDMINALKRHNIPVSGIDRMTLTEHLAIQDLIVLGKFLLLPQDDLSLATLLKTPFIGLNEDELYQLCIDRNDKSLWQSLKERHLENEKYTAAYNYLLDLLNKTDFVPIYELYHYILETCDGRKQCIARLGDEVNEPIDEFLSICLSYEQNHTPSLQEFIHWLTSDSLEIKRDLDQSNNQVRIMTIHGAKGLQAPIVFLPDTTDTTSKYKKLYWTNSKDPMLLWSAQSSYDNTCIKDQKKKIRKYEAEESLRQLYVALTRAEDELYITGYINKKQKPETWWYNIVKEAIKPAAKEKQDIIYLQNTGKTEATETQPREKTPEEPLPEILLQRAKVESRPELLNPSTMEEQSESTISPLHYKSTLKGKIIHKLLEHLPVIAANKQETTINAYLQNYQNEFSEKEMQKIKNNIMAVLKNSDFKQLFSNNSKAEVAVIGKRGNAHISGQIDRLVITDKSVLIIDYKTNHNPPTLESEVSSTYIKQLKAYKDLLAEIYPNKKIRCALLWTETAHFMEIAV